MSLFINLLNLHSANKPVEDFFTEIIAYFFSVNKDILIAWLKSNSIITEDNYSSINISTQKYYKPLPHHDRGSQPDIVIELSNDSRTDVIFIESKIGSTEGWHQLENYAEILSHLSYPSHRTLIYITCNYEDEKKFKILELNLQPNVSFFQLRWYQFYSFLKEHTTDILAEEILSFMRNIRMSKNNQFSVMDLLTMSNFNQTLQLMEETLNGDVINKFEQVFGKVAKPVASTSMTQWRWHGRYIIYTNLSASRGDFWCGLGYFNLNSNTLNEYPYLGILLEVSPGFSERQKIIASMQRVISEKPDVWSSHNLYSSSQWSNIFYQKSLQSFLSETDHLTVTKTFLLDAIDKLKGIQYYFDFPWKGLRVELEEAQEEADIFSSAFAEL